MLRNFTELYSIDLSKYVRKKPTFFKDANGKMQKNQESKWLDYIEWATILTLLYKEGAEFVTFTSTLSKTKPATLEIIVCIDNRTFKCDYPIIDGSTVIASPNQMQIHRAEARGFVKCVAIHTGLGLSLWQKEETILNESIPDENILVSQIKGCKTTEDLFTLFNAHKDEFESNVELKKLLTDRRIEIGNYGK